MIFSFFVVLKNTYLGSVGTDSNIVGVRNFSISQRYLRKLCVRVVVNCMRGHGRNKIYVKKKQPMIQILVFYFNNVQFVLIACPHSRKLREQGVGDEFDYAVTLSVYIATQTRRRCCWLRWHGVCGSAWLLTTLTPYLGSQLLHHALACLYVVECFNIKEVDDSLLLSIWVMAIQSNAGSNASNIGFKRDVSRDFRPQFFPWLTHLGRW